MASKKSFLDLEKVKAELQKYGVEDTDSEIEKIEKQIKSTLNSYREKNKIAREQKLCLFQKYTILQKA